MAAVTALFMIVIDTTKISVSIVPTAIFVVLYGVMRAFKQATNASVNSLQVDIVDYEFYLHGKYLGPLVSSVSNVLGKIFDSISSVIIAGDVVPLVGYPRVGFSGVCDRHALVSADEGKDGGNPNCKQSAQRVKCCRLRGGTGCKGKCRK